MRTILLVTALFLVTLNANAQHISSPDSSEKRTFIGAELSTTGYYVIGKPKYMFKMGVMPYLTVHYGYQLSKRASIQAGIGYGANMGTIYSSRYASADSVYDVTGTQDIKALVMPVTLRFTPFNPQKRLQLYMHATLAPVIGHIKASSSESFDGNTKEVYNENYNSLNVVATAGLSADYKISNRYTGFINSTLFYQNLHKRGRVHQSQPFYFGIGVNYNL